MSESAGSLLLCVRLLPGENPPQPLFLTVRVDGAAVEPGISFPATGSPDRRCISVPIVDDRVVEYDERLTVELSSFGGASVTLLPSTATINITDNDCEFVWECCITQCK